MHTVRARVLSPQSPQDVLWIDDGVVVWDDEGRLLEVQPYDGRPVDDDLRPGVITPGFIDSHIHFPQMRIVGEASGPLLDWLAQSAFPEETERYDLTDTTYCPVCYPCDGHVGFDICNP